MKKSNKQSQTIIQTLPDELWSRIVLFINQTDIKNVCLFGHYTNNQNIVYYGTQQYQHNLYLVTPTLFNIFKLFVNLSNIKDRLTYINHHSNIYISSIQTTYKQKLICYYATKYWETCIQDKKLKQIFVNSCKNILEYQYNIFNHFHEKQSKIFGISRQETKQYF
jgi:hypothetical protein